MRRKEVKGVGRGEKGRRERWHKDEKIHRKQESGREIEGEKGKCILQGAKKRRNGDIWGRKGGKEGRKWWR